MRVALAFLLALCALIYNVHGDGKGFKAKGVDLKKKLVHKIFHHNHHHHYHHHYTHHPHHPHHHHQHHHHYHYHHHPHHHRHHDGKNKHHNYYRHHHHYHNPFKHHLHSHHHPHKKTFHRHPHKQPLHQHHHLHQQHQPLHQYHRLHKQHIQKHHKDVGHHHSNKRSSITHAPVPNKLQLHVRIKDSQGTKRQSLPDLLANLGQHLVKLGGSLSPKTSQMAVHGNTENEGDVRNEVPEAKSSTVQDSSFAIPAVSLKKNVSVNEVESLLHHALDAANGDEMESAFSRNGATEASDPDATAAGSRTDGATAADRRNETFPEAELYGRPLDDREYDASERQREPANGTLEEIAAQSFQTENTRQLDQTRNSQSNAGKENKPAVHDQDQSTNVEPKTKVDDVDTNTELEHKKIQENSSQNDSPKLKTQSLSEKLKSSDMNSTLEDEGLEIDKDTSKSGADESQKSATGKSDAQDITGDERKKTEVSGSGEEPFDDDDTEEQTSTDNKESLEAKSADQAPSKPSQDKEVNLAEESIDQNTIGQPVRESEGKPFINQTEGSLDEPTKPVSEGNIDRQAVVNVAENQFMGNQSDDSFQPDSTEGADLKMGGSNLGNDKFINPSDSNDPEKTVSLDSHIKGGSIQDAKLRGDLDTLAIQHAFSGFEKSVPATNFKNVLQTKNGGPTTQLEAMTVNSNPSNEQDHPALNDIDKASGASNVGQESSQENEGTRDQDSHTDIVGFTEGPKTPAVLDEPAEPSSPSDADPQVVNVESPQEGNLQEDTSQEAFPGDVADAIPVYTLSSPVGDDTFRGDESILSTPTSSVTTSSVNFIDTGGNISTGYSESPSSSEEYGTFTAPASQSQEEFDSLSQGAVVQRDMLDDPVQESLETTADSKSS